GSMTVRSRESVRRRYPASCRISAADSDSEPLLGTATRSMGKDPFGKSRTGRRKSTARTARAPRRGNAHRPSQMLVDVLELQSPPHHQHLHPIQQLRDLLGQLLVGLVFGGDPHLAGLLDHLFALRMDTG